MLLQQRRRDQANSQPIAEMVNSLLREQRPWSEFFERFLWPEHLRERVLTNLNYYAANYVVIGGGCSLVAVLAQPTLILVLVCLI